MTIEELIAAAEQLVNDGYADMDSGVMLDITGRWTGIKGISTDESGRTLLIESED